MMALYLMSLRRMLVRPGALVLSIFGIALGIALVTALNVSLSSIDASIRSAESAGSSEPSGQSFDDNTAISIIARSPRGFDAGLLSLVSQEAAIGSIVPQVRSSVMVDQQPTLVVGDERVASPLAGTAIAPKDSNRQVEVVTALGTTSIAVSPAPSGEAGVNGGAVLYLPLDQAQTLTGRPGRLDMVTATVTAYDDGDGSPTDHTRPFVISRLQGVLGTSVVVAPAEQERQFATAALRQVQSPMMLMSAIALMAGGFLVFNTIQSSARLQERDMAVLRAIGATGRQTATAFVLEAAVLGLVGSAVGLIAGLSLGRFIIGRLPGLVATLAGTEISYHFEPRVLVGALILGPVTAVLAAAIPIRRLLRHRPSRVLAQHGLANGAERNRVATDSSDLGTVRRQPAINRRVTAIGVATLVIGAMAATTTTMAVAQNGLALLLAGILTVGYGIRDVLGRMAASLAGRLGELGSIVEADLGQARARVWSTMAAVIAALVMSLAIGGAARNQVETVGSHYQAAADIDLWVSTAEGDDLGLDFNFEPAAVERVAALAEVETVVPIGVSFLTVGDRRVAVNGIGGNTTLPAFGLADESARLGLLAGDGAIITIQMARSFDLSIGDEFTFDGVDGPITVEILDITETIAPSPSGTLLLSWPHYVATLGDDGIDTFEVHLATGPEAADISGAADRIRDLLAGPTPLVVLPGPAWSDDVVAATREAANVFMVVVTVVIVVAGLAILNATASSVVERQRLLGVLRAIGATPRQIRRLVMIEVVCAGAVGTAIGVAAGMLMHRVAVHITNNTTPFPEDYAFSWPSLAQGLGSAAVAVVVGGLVPAWQQSRRRLADVLAYE